MEQAQQGDRDAYRHLLAYAEGLVRKYLLRRMAVRGDVVDVVQEVLLSVHKARHTYEPGRPFDPWLYAICHYRLQDYLRRFYRNQEDVCEDFSRVMDLLEQPADEQAEIQQLLSTALSCLNDKQRMIVEKLYIQERAAQEVAEEMQISVPDVRTTAHRAMKRMRETLEGMA